MIRIRRRLSGAKAIVDSTALEDPNLSFRAKGLFAYLQSHPVGFIADVKSLERASAEGCAAIETAIKELIECGYAERVDPSGVKVPTADPDALAFRKGLMDSMFDQLPPIPSSRAGTAEGKQRNRSSTPKEETRERIERIIDRLNLLRERSWDWARYTALSAKHAKNVEHISGRLREGYTMEDLMLVLDYFATTDGGKEESRRYFNCVTPFNTKNFERNLAMARDWEARGRRSPGRKPPGTSRGKDYYLGEGDE